MNQGAKLDALENFLVSTDDMATMNKAAKKFEEAEERGAALESPFVGDDLAIYRKSTTDDRERQFIATLKIVQALRAELAQYNEKLADVECLFGDAVQLTFDYLSLLFNDSHEVQLEKVQEIALAAWMKIATAMKSQPLAKALLAYFKALLNVAEQLISGLEEEGVYLDRNFLMAVVTDHGIAKTPEGLAAIQEWKSTNNEKGDMDFEQRDKALQDFIQDLDDVCDKAAAIAAVFVEIAPSVVLEKAHRAMKTAAYHALCQTIYLYAGQMNRHQMEFYATQLSKAQSEEKEQKFVQKIVELEAETGQNETAARITREKAAGHLKSVGLSVARKSQLFN